MELNITTVELGKRVYNNKSQEYKNEDGSIKYTDDEAIKALCAKAFEPSGRVKEIEAFRTYNSLIVEVAETEAQAKIQPIIDMIANYDKVGINDTKVYTVPKRAKITMALTASGSGVDFQRIAVGTTKYPARPEKHQFGVKYNISEMISDPVNQFRKAVDYVIEYKVKYIFNKIMALAKAGKTDGKIPTSQWKEAANISFMDFRKIENSLMRYGNGVTPIMIADRNLIDAFTIKEMTTDLGLSGKEGILATDELKMSLLRGTDMTKVSRTLCIPTDNPFTDNLNSKVDLPVNEGIVLAGGEKSPFRITEFGEMREMSDLLPQIEGEDVNMKIDLKMDITLLVGQAIAYVKDTAVTL